MGHPVKRGQALRERLPLTALVCEVSQARRHSETRGERKDQGKPALLAWPWSQRSTGPPLWAKTGEPHSADGARRAPRHLQGAGCVCQPAPGRRLSGCQAQWGRRERAPSHASARPQRRVGGGRGVGAPENGVHGEGPPWRRPRACEKRATQVPSAGARCPRVDTGGTGDMGTDAAWALQGAQAKVRSRRPEKWHVRFATGSVRKREKDRALRLPNCLAAASRRA